MTETCPICGAGGACAVDSEGRPMVHTDAEFPVSADELVEVA